MSLLLLFNAAAAAPVISPDPTTLEWDVTLDELADVYQEITINGGPFTGLGYANLTPSLDDGGVFDPQAPVGNVMRVYFLGGSAVGGTGDFYGSFDIVADGATPFTVQLHARVREVVVPQPAAPRRYYVPPKRKPKVRQAQLSIAIATEARFAGRVGARIRPGRVVIPLGATVAMAGDVEIPGLTDALESALALLYDDFTVSVSDA